MLFSEVYGAYFEAVSDILSKAVQDRLDQQTILRIVQEKGFAESILTIPQNLTDGTWPLLTADLHTPLRHQPHQPMTLLQKQWLKALLLDPRIRLFDVSGTGLEGIEPLFSPEQFVYYDRYTDGDPFEDEGYIARFKTICEAIHTHRRVEVTFDSSHGHHCVWKVVPFRIEYSSVDDKFRLLVFSPIRKIATINLARVTQAKLCEAWPRGAFTEPKIRNHELVFELVDERNALERAMLQFSYLTKETERLEEKHYRVTLHYRREDETELLIKLMSFGPRIKVISPDHMVEQTKERINRQILLQQAGKDRI